MQTKTNTVKVDRAAAEKYLADIDNGSTITGSMVVKGTTKVNLTIYQSVSTLVQLGVTLPISTNCPG